MTMSEYEEMYAVISSTYGTWPFTQASWAWNFLEQAMRLHTKTPTTWHIDKIVVCVQPHHDYQHALLSRVDSEISDLVEAIKEIDGNDYQCSYNIESSLHIMNYDQQMNDLFDEMFKGKKFTKE